MVDVCLLGTGTPEPDPGRAGSGVAVVHDGDWLLVDCGRGVAQRAMQAGLDLLRLKAVLLTHHHSDHVSDLATLATARWTAGAVLPLAVVAATGPCARSASRCLEPFEDQCFYGQADSASGDRPTIAVEAFVATEEPAWVLETAEWTVESVLVDHAPIEAAVAYAISTGGRRIVVSGDTAACRGVAALAEGADVLLHEALRSDRVPPSLLTWNASASSVGALAAAAGVSQLVLTHLLPAPRSADDEDAFVAEARDGGYAGTIHVARDLARIDVP